MRCLRCVIECFPAFRLRRSETHQLSGSNESSDRGLARVALEKGPFHSVPY